MGNVIRNLTLRGWNKEDDDSDDGMRMRMRMIDDGDDEAATKNEETVFS